MLVSHPITTQTSGGAVHSPSADRSVAVEAVDMRVLASFDEAQEPGEPDFVVELIDLYLNEAPQRFEAIRCSVAQTDGPLLKQAAHALKGSSASLGIHQVAEICHKLEHNDLPNSVSSTEAQVQLLEHKFAKARDVLLTERERRLHACSDS